MKISCEIVKDLLPLYHDEICSEQSRIVVDEHLQECENCKSELSSINIDLTQAGFGKEVEKAKYKTFLEIKKKLFRKSIKIILFSILCTAAVLFGLFYLLFHYQTPISYEAGLISVDKVYENAIGITFKGDDFYGSYGFTKMVEKDGLVQNVAYIYYTDSIWTKYFSKPQNSKGYQFTIRNENILNSDENGNAVIFEPEDIFAVYYLIGDYRDLVEMKDDEFLKNTQDAILLWSK